MICFADTSPTDRAALEQMATTAAGLPGTYVLDPTYVPPDSWLIDNVYGLAGPHIVDAFERELRDRGEWDGRYPAIFLNVDFIESDVAAVVDNDHALGSSITEQWTLATYCHELAHVIDHEDMRAVPPMMLPHAGAILRATLTAPVDKRPPVAVPWRDHGFRWLRASLHLAERIERMTGVTIPLSRVAHLEGYGLSGIYSYAAALGNEPEECLDLPLTDVLATAAPAGFIDLWRADVAAYVRRLPSDQKETFLKELP